MINRLSNTWIAINSVCHCVLIH